jgi:hypothetical protein
LVIAAAATASCGPSRPPWADGAIVHTERPVDARPQDLGNLPARILAAHNRERAAVGSPPLSWDPALASAAAAYAPALARTGRLAHSPREARIGQGENLWMGTRGAYRVEEALAGWTEEKRLFRAGSFPEVSSSGHWSDVAHYTQIIWRDTTRIGCAWQSSDRWDFLVCRYSPPGNVSGQRAP